MGESGSSGRVFGKRHRRTTRFRLLVESSSLGASFLNQAPATCPVDEHSNPATLPTTCDITCYGGTNSSGQTPIIAVEDKEASSSCQNSVGSSHNAELHNQFCRGNTSSHDHGFHGNTTRRKSSSSGSFSTNDEISEQVPQWMKDVLCSNRKVSATRSCNSDKSRKSETEGRGDRVRSLSMRNQGSPVGRTKAASNWLRVVEKAAPTNKSSTSLCKGRVGYRT